MLHTNLYLRHLSQTSTQRDKDQNKPKASLVLLASFNHSTVFISKWQKHIFSHTIEAYTHTDSFGFISPGFEKPDFCLQPQCCGTKRNFVCDALKTTKWNRFFAVLKKKHTYKISNKIPFTHYIVRLTGRFKRQSQANLKQSARTTCLKRYSVISGKPPFNLIIRKGVYSRVNGSVRLHLGAAVIWDEC